MKRHYRKPGERCCKGYDNDMSEERVDILIVGGGPGGMSALLWCHSLGLRGLLLEKQPQLGGQMLMMFHRIVDYAGLIAPDGSDLARRFVEHLQALQLAYNVMQPVVETDLKSLRIRTDKAWLGARAIIVATGARKRRLGVPGEDRFDGAGVSFTATRDHPIFAGREVVIVGGGDSAFEGALMLARVCPQVTLIHRGETFRARAEWVREVRTHPRIAIRTNTEVIAIEGEGAPSRVLVEHNLTRAREAIPAQGVFVRLGMAPNTEIFAAELALDHAGYFLVDSRQKTSAKMVYAVGDACAGISQSIASAVGQAAVAVKSIASDFGI
ncbi:MAG: NAD(P)/FAD-dependent oxidoreductase [Acidobacteriota bacterium]